MTVETDEYGEGDGPIVLEHAYDESTPASVAVVQAICALEDVDPADAPSDLGFTLYDHVDPGALDAVVADGAGDGDVVVQLALGDYRLSVSDTGRIRIRSRE